MVDLPFSHFIPDSWCGFVFIGHGGHIERCAISNIGPLFSFGHIHHAKRPVLFNSSKVYLTLPDTTGEISFVR